MQGQRFYCREVFKWSAVAQWCALSECHVCHNQVHKQATYLSKCDLAQERVLKPLIVFISILKKIVVMTNLWKWINCRTLIDYIFKL